MIWVGCQLRFFSHVGDGAPDVPLRRVTPFCFITNFVDVPCSEILRPFFSQSTEHCTNIARMSRQQSRDAEGVVPYNPEFTAYSKHRRTMFAPTSHSGKFLPPQNRSALCVSTLRLGLERRCRFNSPISLSSDILFLSAFDTTICTLSAYAE
jgi:hypothetical protein